MRTGSWLTVLSIRDAGTDRRTSAQSRSVPPEWKAPHVLSFTFSLLHLIFNPYMRVLLPVLFSEIELAIVL